MTSNELIENIAAAPLKKGKLDIEGKFQERLRSALKARNDAFLEKSKMDFEEYSNLEIW